MACLASVSRHAGPGKPASIIAQVYSTGPGTVPNTLSTAVVCGWGTSHCSAGFSVGT